MMNKQENAIDRPLFQGLAARIPNSQVRPSNGRIIAKLFKAYQKSFSVFFLIPVLTACAFLSLRTLLMAKTAKMILTSMIAITGARKAQIKPFSDGSQHKFMSFPSQSLATE